jgi:hypothetical protein
MRQNYLQQNPKLYTSDVDPHWFLLSFNADPDTAFYQNADPDPGSQTNADPCGSGSWSDFNVTKG